MSDLEELPYQMYETKINKLQSKTTGTLIVKEYPTASAHVGHFKNLLSELALKKSFKPDVLFIDYLNICSSSRFKGGNISSYFYVKAIAEELRGLAVQYNVPIMSATQTTRTGFVSTDIGLEDTAESFGLPTSYNLIFALSTPTINDRLIARSLYLFFNCLIFNCPNASKSSLDIIANIKSAVAGKPKLSAVSSKPISVETNPVLVVCVAENKGTLNSTASPLNSSAIALI
jgi:hypothetical protein